MTVHVPETVVTTTTALASSLSSATSGQSVTFTATVSAATSSGAQPGGFVTFTIDGVSQAPVAVSAIAGGLGVDADDERALCGLAPGERGVQRRLELRVECVEHGG